MEFENTFLNNKNNNRKYTEEKPYLTPNSHRELFINTHGDIMEHVKDKGSIEEYVQIVDKDILKFIIETYKEEIFNILFPAIETNINNISGGCPQGKSSTALLSDDQDSKYKSFRYKYHFECINGFNCYNIISAALALQYTHPGAKFGFNIYNGKIIIDNFGNYNKDYLRDSVENINTLYFCPQIDY